jgi:carbamate kinase
LSPHTPSPSLTPIIVAIGGNALVDMDAPPTVQSQFAVTARAVEPVAELLMRHVRMVIVHGNGPQVGFMALRSAIARGQIHEVPLDSLVADTQGAMGYMIQRALREALGRRGLEVPVITVVTEVECDPEDEAFGHPNKPIGRFYDEAEAHALEKERGWAMMEDAGRGWRRVVPSPAPVRIVQLDSVRALLDDDAVVIACGGGGIPVVRHADGHLSDLEAVIDKDRVSALLGVRLGAERLFLTTATDAIYRDFGTPRASRIEQVTVAELRELIDAGIFPAGSMAPKVEAAVRFLVNGGKEAIICSPEQLLDAYEGRAGTRIVP